MTPIGVKFILKPLHFTFRSILDSTDIGMMLEDNKRRNDKVGNDSNCTVMPMWWNKSDEWCNNSNRHRTDDG